MHKRNHLEAAEELVNQELDMLVRQPLELDNVVEVRSHQIGNQVAAEGAENRARRQVNIVCTMKEPKTHSSLNSSSAAAGVKTSSRPMTCKDGSTAYTVVGLINS